MLFVISIVPFLSAVAIAFLYILVVFVFCVCCFFASRVVSFLQPTVAGRSSLFIYMSSVVSNSLFIS